MKTNKKQLLLGAFALMLGAGVCGLATSVKTADVGASAKTMDQIELSMVKGATMRIAGSPEASTTGLRFIMQVPKSDYEAIDATIYTDVEWGVLIAPVDSVEKADFTVDNLFGENAKYVFNRELTSEDEDKYAAINVTETALTLASNTAFDVENPDSTYVFAGYMHTIKDENLTRGFVGRGYVKYTEGGVVKYRLADYAESDRENNARSAYYVGAKYVEANTGTQSDYVKENYLSTVDSQDKQLVNVAVSDYYEDITIGSYKSEADEIVQKTVAIGHKLTVAELSETKEGYTLRSDLSDLTDFEPTYARTDLKATRKYESNEWIPFSTTAGAVTKVTEEGDFKGAYKFEGTSIQFANSNNYKIIKGVTVPEDSKVHLVNYVTMKVYCTTDGDYNFISRLGDCVVGSPAWCVSMDWYTTEAANGKAVNGSSVAYYDENGTKTFIVSANTWYTISFPIRTNYHDGARFGDAYWQLHSNNTLYFKDVKIENKAEDPMEKAAAYSEFLLRTNGKTTKTTDVTEGDFAGMKKLEATSGGWTDGLLFVNTDILDSTKTNESMLKNKGARYLYVDVYFTGATTGFGWWDNVCKDKDCLDVSVVLGEALPAFKYKFTYNNNGAWGLWDGYNYGNNKTLDMVWFKDQDGNAVTQLEKDTWYTMVISLTTDKNGWWGNMKLTLKGGSAETPAVMYYDNFRYASAKA